MPRDSKSPLIQKIARQAYATFRGFDASAVGTDQAFLDKQNELIELVTAVRAADLKIAPRQSQAGSKAELASPPVTYMHICETDAFSMGVFLLRSGASIPLHDHPGMNGVLKVLYGKVSVTCFDKLEGGRGARGEPPPTQSAAAARRSVGEYSEDSGPCLLTPLRHNLHQIDAVEGPAAFLDILAPPYDPDDGRDCHYYKVLQATGAGGPDGDPKERRDEEEEKEKEEVMWLLEIPQPEDFWCGGEPYRGPAVSV
ncbi:2-aminoethanethiol (cysteamine) dioxygenase a [Lampris incognitus]|uniref:2-aminoethanethiol (cysteamine) dioxygenase a n=1 Tax=Lampris incognitus TaxID=2546036 RepID=UPI0024B53565|nr:2-aminoethanethiol (cysteamine) dioxygenase a [Lampris incognitus]